MNAQTTTAPFATADKAKKTNARKGKKTAPVAEPVKELNEVETTEELVSDPVVENEEVVEKPNEEVVSDPPEPEEEEDEEAEALRVLEEIRKKKAEKKLREEIKTLRENWNKVKERERDEFLRQIEKIKNEIAVLDAEIKATNEGENDDLLVKLALQKTTATTQKVVKQKTTTTATTGEPRTKTQITRPELYELCSKKTSFKCVWAKGVEYVGIYDPEKRVLEWKGHEFKNLNDWINGKEKVVGVSIADERNQKTSAKSAWKVCYVLNETTNEWVFCDTLVKGCPKVN